MVEEKRQPLWRRDMPGLKHIRGILYEEYPMGQIDESSGSTKNSFYQGKYRIRLGLNQFLIIMLKDRLNLKTFILLHISTQQKVSC